jgi:uncharacterized membrane protein
MNRRAASTSLAIALGLAALAPASAALAQPVPMKEGMEKCFGIAAKAKNDCAAGAHSCAGQATKDRDPASFVMLPAGACGKISGGKLTAA